MLSEEADKIRMWNGDEQDYKYETADLAPHKDTLLRNTKVASDKANVRVETLNVS